MMFEAWLQLRGEAPEERRIRTVARPHAGPHPQPGRLPGRDGAASSSILGTELSA